MPGFPDAIPLAGLAGGLLIGLAAALMLLGIGRIAGVSGLLGRAAAINDAGPPRWVALAFVAGLPLGASLAAAFSGSVTVRPVASLPMLLLAGLLVGFGTRMGSGCTSGHGVCGLSRLSRRSLLATALFMGSGFATVGLMRAGGML